VTESTEPSEKPTNNAPIDRGGVSPSETTTPDRYKVSEVEEPVDRETGRRREEVRGTVTYWLMGIFAGVLLVGAITIFVGGQSWTNAQDFLQTAIPAITGLLGSAMGFYFGRLR
jgi:hypothetical protein